MQPPAPGFYYGLSFEEYLAIPAINKSGLDHYAVNPAAYYANCLDENRVIKPPTPAMELGTAIHAAILEPEVFVARYAVVPESAPKRPTEAQWEAKKPSKSSVEAMEWWTDFELANVGKEILKPHEWAKLEAIRFSAKRHRGLQEILKRGRSEVTIVWTDEETGWLCKGRLDWLDDSLALDLKSTTDAGTRAFSKQIASMEWDVQSAFYTDGLKALGRADPLFIFGALEKEWPYPIRLLMPSTSWVDIGRKHYRKRLKLHVECVKSGKWPGYTDEIEMIQPPRWREMDDSNADE